MDLDEPVLLPDPEPRPIIVPVISVDDHLIEPHDLFVGRVPAALAERRAPQSSRTTERLPVLALRGPDLPEHRRSTPWPAGPRKPGAWTRRASTRCGPGASTSTPGSPTWTSTASGRRCASRRWWPGSAGRCSPGRGSRSSAWPACGPGTTGTCDVWAGTYPDRIIPLQLPWLADIEMATAEVRRNADRGFKAVSFPEFPARPWASRPSSPGSGTRSSPPARRPRRWSACTPGPRRGLPAAVAGAALRAHAHPVPRERPHRRGRMAVVRSALALPPSERGHVRGWDRLGAHAHRPGRLRPQSLGLGDRSRRPGRRISRPAKSCAATSGSAPSTIPRSSILRHRIGVDHIMVESDYPHADSTWPDTQALLQKTLGHLPDDELRKIAGRQRRAVCSATRLPGQATTGGPSRDSSRRRPARWSTPTGTSSNHAAWDAVPERSTGPGSRPTPTATSTWWWATPRSWPSRSARWPPRGAASATRTISGPWRRPGPAARIRRARLADMDAEGIDRAVLFPSVGLVLLGPRRPGRRPWPSPGLQRLAGRLLRRPTRTGCSARPCCPSRTRPPRPPSCAGPTASSVSRPPSSGPTPVGVGRCRDPAYEPIWDAAEEVGMAIGIHEGSSVIVPTLGSRPALQPVDPARRLARLRRDAGLRPTDRLRRPRASPGPARRLPRVEWRMGPVLARTARRAGRELRRLLPRAQRLTPSEYFARQCWISFEIDEHTLPALAPVHRRGPHRVGIGLPPPRRHLSRGGDDAAAHPLPARRRPRRTRSSAPTPPSSTATALARRRSPRREAGR